MGDVLADLGALDPTWRAVLEGLVEEHVRRHGDVTKSLAALPDIWRAWANSRPVGPPVITVLEPPETA